MHNVAADGNIAYVGATNFPAEHIDVLGNTIVLENADMELVVLQVHR